MIDCKAFVKHMGIATLALLLAAAACPAQEPIKVAAVFAKTGKAAASNLLHLEAVRFAVDEINQGGGLLDRGVVLLEFDNASTAIGARKAARDAVAAGVCTVIGASWSSHSLAMAPVLQTAGVPMISPVSTHPDVTLAGDCIFRVCYTDAFQGAVMAEFAVSGLGAATAAILTNVSSSYSAGLADQFRQRFQWLGGRIPWTANYHDKATDFEPVLDKARQVRPDVIFVPGYQQDSALIVKQARRMGIDSIFLGGDGWNDGMYRYAGGAIEGAYYSDHWHRDIATPESRRFLQQYERRHGPMNNAAVALAYDAVGVWAEAVKRAGSNDPSRLRRALAAVDDFRGVTGRIDIDPNGDAVKPAVILQFKNGGSLFVKQVSP